MNWRYLGLKSTSKFGSVTFLSRSPTEVKVVMVVQGYKATLESRGGDNGLNHVQVLTFHWLPVQETHCIQHNLFYDYYFEKQVSFFYCYTHRMKVFRAASSLTTYYESLSFSLTCIKHKMYCFSPPEAISLPHRPTPSFSTACAFVHLWEGRTSCFSFSVCFVQAHERSLLKPVFCFCVAHNKLDLLNF